MFDFISAFFAALPFTRATWFTLCTLFFFIWLFAKASRDPRSPVKWEHLILDSSNDRASPYKVGYLIGVAIATQIVVRLSDADKLTYDIFGMYLTYLLGGAGVNSFVKSKATTDDSNQSGAYVVPSQRRATIQQAPADDEPIPRP